MTRRRPTAIALSLLCVALLAVFGCTASDPFPENFYFSSLFTQQLGSATENVSDAYINHLHVGMVTGNTTENTVTADAVLTNNYIVIGDGGGRGVRTSLATINAFGTLYAPVLMAGNIVSSGKVEADRLYAGLEGYSIDVVRASSLGFSVNDTLTLDFLFEPDVIVLDYSCRCAHDSTYEPGHTTGHSVVTVEGADTISCVTSCSVLFSNNGTIAATSINASTSYVVIAYGGSDGSTDSYIFAPATWDTATHNMTITFSTIHDAHDVFNFVEMVATAYR